MRFGSVTFGYLLSALCLFANSAFSAGELPDLIARIKPSIVVIGTFDSLASPPFSMKGTGFVVADGKTIATNAHVLDKATDSSNAVLSIAVNPGSKSPQIRRVSRLALDEIHDLALLRLDGDSIPAIRLDEGELVREGSEVAFTGFPIGGALGFSPVTHRGVVSAVTSIAPPAVSTRAMSGRFIQAVREGRYDVYQLDATAYPGNSGSPVFDLEHGSVIGVINMVFIKGTREAALSQPSGIAYAIPVAYLRALLARSHADN